MSKSNTPGLHALVERLIDYAGMYPPAALPLETTLANFEGYRKNDFSWMLRSFVVGVAELPKIPSSLDGQLAILSESDDTRAASIESKGVVKAKHPVYWEVAPNSLPMLDEVQASGCFAKIRTGGVKAEAIPAPAHVAAFIKACAERKLAFKATAGLHHAVRGTYPLTYEADAPRAVMHGFLNVLLAAAFAWNGEADIQPILEETDARAFRFDDGAHFRDKSLTYEQIRSARRHFMHSIGSCSFEEPVQELQQLGLL